MAGRTQAGDPLSIPVGRLAQANVTRGTDGVRITLAGELDLANADLAGRILREAVQVDARSADAVLDLRAVTCIEGAARGALRAWREHCAGRGIAVHVIAPESRGARVSVELGCVFAETDGPPAPAGSGI